MNSGTNFSGYCRGPYVLDPRVMTMSYPKVWWMASACRSPPALLAE